MDGVRPKCSVLASRTALQVAGRDLDLDVCRAQALEALPADLRRRISRRADDARDAGLDQRVGTWRLTSVVRAGLERHVRGRTLRSGGAGQQRVRLGMALAGTDVPPLAEHLAVADDHAADHRVRARREPASLGELERPLEEAGVVAGHAKPAAATIAR